MKYSITMGIRVLCLAALPFVQGGWMFVVAAGAIFLPYVAVVLANVESSPGASTLEHPSGVVAVVGPPVGGRFQPSDSPQADGPNTDRANTDRASADSAEPEGEQR